MNRLDTRTELHVSSPAVSCDYPSTPTLTIAILASQTDPNTRANIYLNSTADSGIQVTYCGASLSPVLYDGAFLEIKTPFDQSVCNYVYVNSPFMGQTDPRKWPFNGDGIWRHEGRNYVFSLPPVVAGDYQDCEVTYSWASSLSAVDEGGSGSVAIKIKIRVKRLSQTYP